LSGGSTDVKSLPGVAEVGSGGSDPLSPPGRSVAPVGQGGGMPIGYDANLQTWHQPFIMAGVNTPVVRKSASILSYGAACHVEEVQASKSLMAAITGTASLALMALLAIPPLRALLFALKVLPKPGEGPSKELRDSGYFHMYTLGVGERTADGDEPPLVIADIRSGSAGDPGYKATAQMSIEAALCLALNRDACTAGVLTPASALGLALVDRLNASGMSLSVRALANDAPIELKQ